MRVAIVYDRVNKWGGAERVLLSLHEMFPDAPLFTSVYNSQTASWATVFPSIKTSFLQKIPFAKSHHEALAFLMPIAFESFDFSEYDLVISVTSEAAKGIITNPATKHICICLTPTRYLWSHYNTYFKGDTFKGISRPVVNYLRSWDKIAAQRPDEIIAISKEVQSRIEKYYGRKSEIIYPPAGSAKFETRNPKYKQNSKRYFLVVSRLVKYKKVDLVIDVFNDLGLPLVIVGKGKEENYLKSKAKNNIKFLYDLTDRELSNYYRGARALIMPQREDFGLVAVEAQMHGTPVISYKGGGASDTVVDDKTGILFEKQDKKSLVNAILSFQKKNFDQKGIIKNASQFSKKNFEKNLLSIIDSKIK